jgi:tRNA1Val (adenine37-N6)-methyltransferase
VSNTPFRFKQFEIAQDQCAMKVGTDGVLLGAWANLTDSKIICDIGTGTGLIAIMAAQRNSIAQIITVEIDGKASEQAKLNAQNCTWGKRIEVYHDDFNEISLKYKPDHFISNPPYFKAESLAKGASRVLARQTVSLNLKQLLFNCKRLGAEKHLLSLIIPIDLFENSQHDFKSFGYFVSRIQIVKPTPAKAPKRVLLELRNHECELKLEKDLVIETQRHVYTPEYIDLCRDFYLKM